MAQFGEQRLIPLAATKADGTTSENDDDPPIANPITNAIEQTFPAHNFVVYGRAPKGYPPGAGNGRDTYIGAGSSEAGILVHVPYGHIPNSLLREPSSTRMPDLETFFDFGGTLELVTTENSLLARQDIVISEIMWAVDRGIDNVPGTNGIAVSNPNFDRSQPPTDTPPANRGEGANPMYILINVPQLLNQEIQWIELYNTTNTAITETLYFLFTPFVSHPTRELVTFSGTTYKVLDSVDTLFAGLWKLPGKSGDRPNTAFVSAYRDINYDTVEDYGLNRASQLTGIPFGANPNSWQATTANGRRNTDLKIVSGTAVLELLSISTPGAKHVTGIHAGRFQQSAVPSNIIVINEVRNDTSTANVDWVELKNVSSGMQQLKDWELSIVRAVDEVLWQDRIALVYAIDEIGALVETDLVEGNLVEHPGGKIDIVHPTGRGTYLVESDLVDLPKYESAVVRPVGRDDYLVDRDLVDLPEYEMAPGEVLLLVNEDPWFTPILAGANAGRVSKREREGAVAYVIDSRLDLPDTGKFMLLLRNKSDKNGKDANIQDYAGNGFFADFSNNVSTQFWPRIGQYQPRASDIAPFGDNTFASRNTAWQRKRYQANDGHHTDAWEAVGERGGLGYDPHTDLLSSPGTPGYENTALKSGNKPLVNGEVSISEIMYDRGPNGSASQWIELYNSSLTEAVNLKGWELDIRNLVDDEGRYIGGKIIFEEVAILPNQTLLIVPKKAATNIADNRIYDLYVRHRSELRMHRTDILLNPKGFYLKLTYEGDPELVGDNVVMDEVGNLTPVFGSLTPPDARAVEWALPPTNAERRRSIVRVYGTLFTPEKNGFDGEPDSPENGLTAEAWRLFPNDSLSFNYYGFLDDLANPGYRRGVPYLWN
ncbi:MAG: lamin tail domain-containing protein [Candidatus Poribacteria bacterium]|nr:lamin tail domain-containing protein [Candidatus Poribacteria bacterium]